MFKYLISLWRTKGEWKTVLIEKKQLSSAFCSHKRDENYSIQNVNNFFALLHFGWFSLMSSSVEAWRYHIKKLLKKPSEHISQSSECATSASREFELSFRSQPSSLLLAHLFTFDERTRAWNFKTLTLEWFMIVMCARRRIRVFTIDLIRFDMWLMIDDENAILKVDPGAATATSTTFKIDELVTQIEYSKFSH